MNGKKYSKKNNELWKKINKSTNKIKEVAPCRNLSRISVFKWCVKEAVVAAVFMFELNLFQIFGPENDIHFCPLFVLQSGVSNATCDLEL